MWFQFSENNSGGSWWLGEPEYAALLKSGRWGIPREDLDFQGSWSRWDRLYNFRQNLIGQFDSLKAARASWEACTGEDLDADGCECCGPPFSLLRAVDQNPQDVIMFDPKFDSDTLPKALETSP